MPDRGLTLTVVAFVFGCLSLPLLAGEGTVEDASPFPVGERLVYRLRWGIIVAGKATLEVKERTEIDGVPAQHIHISIRTTGLVDKLYKVRTKVDSYITLDSARTLLYRKKQREGKTRADIEVEFDWEKRECVYRETGKEPKQLSLPEQATDLVGALYRFRCLRLREGGMFELPVTDGTKIVEGQATITKREKRKVKAGRFDCYKVTPRTQEISGVFEQSDDAELYVWVTRDHRHVPVRVASAVAIGNFIAECIETENLAE